MGALYHYAQYDDEDEDEEEEDEEEDGKEEEYLVVAGRCAFVRKAMIGILAWHRRPQVDCLRVHHGQASHPCRTIWLVLAATATDKRAKQTKEKHSVGRRTRVEGWNVSGGAIS